MQPELSAGIETGALSTELTAATPNLPAAISNAGVNSIQTSLTSAPQAVPQIAATVGVAAIGIATVGLMYHVLNKMVQGKNPVPFAGNSAE